MARQEAKKVAKVNPAKAGGENAKNGNGENQ